jgi:Tfp pilus assembly protein PilF
MTHLRQKSPRYFAFVLCLILAVVAAGCFRNPNVRKQKFVDQGDAYLKEGKYREAQISYARALQIDPRFVPALYKSAQCSMRLGNWNVAFQELSSISEKSISAPAKCRMPKTAP